MITSRNDRFLKGGFIGLLIAAAVFCGAFAARAALPSGYAELEYIESTGTQYIDTGVTITPTMAVEADARFTEIVKQARIFGNLCGTGILLLRDCDYSTTTRQKCIPP